MIRGSLYAITKTDNVNVYDMSGKIVDVVGNGVKFKVVLSYRMTEDRVTIEDNRYVLLENVTLIEGRREGTQFPLVTAISQILTGVTDTLKLLTAGRGQSPVIDRGEVYTYKLPTLTSMTVGKYSIGESVPVREIRYPELIIPDTKESYRIRNEWYSVIGGGYIRKDCSSLNLINQNSFRVKDGEELYTYCTPVVELGTISRVISSGESVKIYVIEEDDLPEDVKVTKVGVIWDPILYMDDSIDLFYITGEGEFVLKKDVYEKAEIGDEDGPSEIEQVPVYLYPTRLSYIKDMLDVGSSVRANVIERHDSNILRANKSSGVDPIDVEDLKETWYELSGLGYVHVSDLKHLDLVKDTEKTTSSKMKSDRQNYGIVDRGIRIVEGGPIALYEYPSRRYSSIVHSVHEGDVIIYENIVLRELMYDRMVDSMPNGDKVETTPEDISNEWYKTDMGYYVPKGMVTEYDNRILDEKDRFTIGVYKYPTEIYCKRQVVELEDILSVRKITSFNEIIKKMSKELLILESDLPGHVALEYSWYVTNSGMYVRIQEWDLKTANTL